MKTSLCFVDMTLGAFGALTLLFILVAPMSGSREERRVELTRTINYQIVLIPMPEATSGDLVISPFEIGVSLRDRHLLGRPIRVSSVDIRHRSQIEDWKEEIPNGAISCSVMQSKRRDGVDSLMLSISFEITTDDDSWQDVLGLGIEGLGGCTVDSVRFECSPPFQAQVLRKALTIQDGQHLFVSSNTPLVDSALGNREMQLIDEPEMNVEPASNGK